MLQQLGVIEGISREALPQINQNRKSELGQFMTPPDLAFFIAKMFPPSDVRVCRLLDAGAGMGALSTAFLSQFGKSREIDITAYEIDDNLRAVCTRNLAGFSNVKANVISGDYIEIATADGLRTRGYTHAILNPPYKKINSKSPQRLALRSVGIETVNLYSAFVALALAELAIGGQLVAIIPRSFCNGPYYRPFREYILKRAAIRHIHLFDSRTTAFKEDNVLQENVIIRLERGGLQGSVTISTSKDDRLENIITNEHPFERIVFPNDVERVIHVPTTTEKCAIELSPVLGHSLVDLGVSVSTGPVVDFRLKEQLRDAPEVGAVPLLYPAHMSHHKTVWPLQNSKKPNAIVKNTISEKWLYPSGFYCIVRRFSSKEEKRRIVASFVDPADFNQYSSLGFENHLNLFHENKQGLPELIARGLTVFLNSTAVDESFRRFNGHTQVNVTDLKLMTYPNREALSKLGYWAKQQKEITQQMIDEQIMGLIT